VLAGAFGVPGPDHGSQTLVKIIGLETARKCRLSEDVDEVDLTRDCPALAGQPAAERPDHSLFVTAHTRQRDDARPPTTTAPCSPRADPLLKQGSTFSL
jgi:hypothetical protein